MAHKLPDEILKEILLPVIDVEDHLFADTSPRSPFSLRCYSNSDILVVCKRWLRVATPLLYRVVVLRSKAQAMALALVLKSHQQFGRFIKKIRLEGGFGASMDKILIAAPNITHIFLSLVIWSNDSVRGLCRGLPLINPSSVILQENGRDRFNAQVDQLCVTLRDCMKVWSNMKTIALSLSAVHERFILQALVHCPSLEELHVSDNSTVSSLLAIAEIPSVKAISIKIRYPSRSLLKSIRNHPKLLKLVKYQDPWSLSRPRSSEILSVSGVPAPLCTSNLNYVPMASVSADIQDKIWSRVFEFALGVRLINGGVRRGNPARASLPLVSKTFQRLSIPYLYRYPVITRLSALKLLAAQLTTNPSLGSFMRYLFVSYTELSPKSRDDINKILSQTRGLLRMHSEDVGSWFNAGLLPRMDWDGFRILGQTSGSTLLAFHNFCIMPSVLPQTPLVFNSFVKLRSLFWCSRTEFKVGQDQIIFTCLPALENIRFTLYHRTFAVILSYMGLPSLSKVAFHDSLTEALPFLITHGSKIREMELSYDQRHPIFDLCPNMTLLTFWSEPMPTPSSFLIATPNHSLKKLVLDMIISNKDDGEFFESLNLNSFPALREIQCRSCYWPTNEREMAKNSWYKWAETLLKWGVKLTDSSGRYWRPRLKAQRR